MVLSLVQFLGLWEIILNLNKILNQQKYHYYQIIEINNLCFGFLKLVIGKIGLADSTLIHNTYTPRGYLQIKSDHKVLRLGFTNNSYDIQSVEHHKAMFIEKSKKILIFE